jgi:hypothetical protein
MTAALVVPATRAQLVRLPAGKVHVVPAYSTRTLCGATEHETAAMAVTPAPGFPGAWCLWCLRQHGSVSVVVEGVTQ